jgi:hypothetical protein
LELTTRLPDALAKFVYSRIGLGDSRFHLSLDEFKSCYGDMLPTEYWYDLRFAEDGIDFIVPIASNGSCGDSIQIPFKELAPFLSKEGEAVAKEF